ncbi:MAG: hypothetical protein KDD73_16455, partial [Anaerolineales bacterium]|nr:hypothetical protein [Anaerolineales bacterium]
MPPLPTWRQMNADATPEVEALQLTRFREAPAWEKLEMLAGLNQMAYDMAYLSLQRRYPAATEEEL